MITRETNQLSGDLYIELQEIFMMENEGTEVTDYVSITKDCWNLWSVVCC